MTEYQMIRKLIEYELRNTPVIKYVMTAFFIVVTAYFGNEFLQIVLTIEGRLPVFYDLLFLMALSIPISLIRYKPFTIQNLKGELYAGSFFILLKQAPISEKTLKKSRFILSGMYTVVLNSLMFGLLYILSEQLQHMLSIKQAIILGISWIAVSYIWGGAIAAAEPGGIYTQLMVFVWLIVFLVVVIGSLTAVNILLDAPFVLWSIEMAQSNPVLLIVISAGIAVIFTLLSNFEYKRYEKKVNYHI